MSDTSFRPPLPSQPTPGANRLLDFLPQVAGDRLRAAGTRVALRRGEILFHSGNRAGHVWFPLTGVISLFVVMQDGRGLDVANVGFEGVLGAWQTLGGSRSGYEAVVHVEGEALQIPAQRFVQVFRNSRVIRRRLLRYAEVCLFQAERSAACNGLHDSEERLARWLLHTQDRVQQENIPLTQEFLAAMLGVRRPTISTAIWQLEHAGAITHDRGIVKIVDRQTLERISCEDYVAIRERFEDFFASAHLADH